MAHIHEAWDDGGVQLADLRDGTADCRDATADGRDSSADERDRIADERDRIAAERDSVAEQFEALVRAGMTADALRRSSLARLEARADRDRASTDRKAGATGRRLAEDDRGAAVADRLASAAERRTASVDGLTGACRREAGFAELERDIGRAHRAGQPLVVAFVDVDHLKAINDAHGHAAGDAVLVAVAKTLRAELRSYDLVFRYGGDEMVCALPGARATDARKRFDRVNVMLARRGDDSGSVTVGLADLQDGDTATALVARADADLYLVRHADLGVSRLEPGPTGAV